MQFAQSERVLGAGSYGKVFLAERGDGTLFALKRMESDESNYASIGAIREICALHSIPAHPNIINAPCSFMRVGLHVYQPLELAANTALNVSRSYVFSKQDALWIALEAAKGLGAMHAAGWLHRDVKLENILILSDGRVKLCDFSLATPMFGRGAPPMLTSYVCTLWVRPPELLYREATDVSMGSYGPEVDVFSLGMCLLAMLRGKYMSNKTKEQTVFDCFLRLLGRDDEIDALLGLDESQKLSYPERHGAVERIAMTAMCSYAIADLLNSMLDPLPSRRIPMRDVVARLEAMIEEPPKLGRLMTELVPSAASLGGIRQRLTLPLKPRTEGRHNRKLAQAVYLYAASHGRPFHIAMMAVQAAHGSMTASTKAPEICELATMLCNQTNAKESSGVKSDRLWDVAGLVYDANIARVCASTTLPPAQKCILASLLCHRTIALEQLTEMLKVPDCLFTAAFALYGPEIRKFGRRYMYNWAPQTQLLESWMRMETSGSTGAAKAEASDAKEAAARKVAEDEEEA